MWDCSAISKHFCCLRLLDVEVITKFDFDIESLIVEVEKMPSVFDVKLKDFSNESAY